MKVQAMVIGIRGSCVALFLINVSVAGAQEASQAVWQTLGARMAKVVGVPHAQIAPRMAYMVEQKVPPGRVVYNMVRLAVVHRLRPSDAYHRWFTEGVSCAVTERLVREHFGDVLADGLAQMLDPGPFEPQRSQLNLRAWLDESWDVPLPFAREEQLAKARRAFAAMLASTLIDRHGEAVIDRILDHLRDQGVGMVGRDQLIAAVSAVTGEDWHARLTAHDAYPTDEAGRRAYAQAYNAAKAQADWPAAASASKRLMEWRPQRRAEDYARLALLLHKAGHPEAADGVLPHVIGRLTETQTKLPYQQLHVAYAVKTKRLAVAQAAAEAVLAVQPNHGQALLVRMNRQAAAQKWIQAKLTGQRIMRSSQDETDLPYVAAQKMVAAVEAMGLNRDDR